MPPRRVADLSLIGRAMARNDELIDRTLIRHWLLWGFFWLMLAPTVGVIISTKFNYPEFFGTHAWSTFGRLRPVHVNGVIWGAFSTLFIGLASGVRRVERPTDT